MKRSVGLCIAGSLALCGSAFGQTLKVGDKAPALSCEKWLKGNEVKGFEKSKGYVVEFWATWCPPCRESIPHLTELQKSNPDVTFIGVASSERGSDDSAKLKTLESFVSDKGGDMAYTVAYDSDRSMSNDWMKPAGQNGIPCAFVVNGEGRIAWIGHPMDDEFEASIGKLKGGQPSAQKPAQPANRPFALMVGDKAPNISISKWVKGDPVTEFEKGRTYVMEFWATWCGPCKAAIPHVTELQAKYKDSKLTVIGVNVWDDAEAVAPFVEKQGDKMGYTVAIDDYSAGAQAQAGKMAKDWLEAAGRNGIPCSMIVDGSGRVAWIGHPMKMEEPLEQVINGTWNIDSESRKYAESLKDESSARKAQENLAKYTDLLGSGKTDEAYAIGRELVDGPAKDSAEALNTIAWMIVDPVNVVEKKDLELALKAASRAAELEPEDGAILDTLAAVYHNKGDLKKALEWQKKAVQFSKGQQYEGEVADRLKQYEAEAAKKGGN